MKTIHVHVLKGRDWIKVQKQGMAHILLLDLWLQRNQHFLVRQPQPIPPCWCKSTFGQVRLIILSAALLLIEGARL